LSYIGRTPIVGNFVKLDAITTSATATYNLLNGGVAYFPQTANNCIVSLNGVIQSPTSAYTISGSTIVFSDALTSSDTIDFILVLGDVLSIGTPSDGTITSAKLASGVSGLISWQSVVTASTLTAVSGRGYFIDTTSNACTITLPASATAGDTIILVDYARKWGTNALTINTNSLKFQGNTSPNPIYNTNGQSVTLIYSGATQGWIPTVDDDVTLETPQTVDIDFLVIAGGGGGGDRFNGDGTDATGGGGGAGGYRTSTQTANLATVITVTVGDGGAGSTSGTNGGTGSNSSISGSGLTTITSNGGGGGGRDKVNGLNGGSGGGGGGETTTSGGTGNTPSTSPSQGNDGGGGRGSPSFKSGGGGGASGIGASGSDSGNGGTGTASSITGSSVERAGGGGGGGNAPTSSAGGTATGGGGAGAGATGSYSSNAVAGTANTGGGGGGGGWINPSGASSGARGASGGKGVVILSLPTAKYSGTSTGSPTVTTSGSNTILTFTGSGSYTT